MSDTNQHEVAESLFERNQRREMEINEALKLEAERHAAAVRNMHQLRALRLARDAKSNNGWQRGSKQVDVRSCARLDKSEVEPCLFGAQKMTQD